MKLEKHAVLPQRRHRGYGRALLDHARHTAAKWDGIRLTADIIGGERPAEELVSPKRVLLHRRQEL